MGDARRIRLLVVHGPHEFRLPGRALLLAAAASAAAAVQLPPALWPFLRLVALGVLLKTAYDVRGISGGLEKIDAKLDKLDASIDALGKEMNEKLDSLDQTLNEKLDEILQ